jgi:hypothetical protein
MKAMSVPPSCPKCQHPRKVGEDACARCGLLVTLWPGWSFERPASPVLDAGWAALEPAWADEAAHARFLELAASVGELELAAARYREVERNRPDDAMARFALGRARLLVERLYAAQALGESHRPVGGWLRGLAIASALVVLASVLWLLTVVMRH